MKDDKPLVLSGKMIEIPLKEEKRWNGLGKAPPRTSPEWMAAAGRLARNYAPPIDPCPVCGWPKMQGRISGHDECEE